MPHPVYVPCVNINDDVVLIVDIGVKAGDQISRGDTIADVETDKAVITVDSEHDGYVLQVLCEVDERVAVGSVMMWVGDSPEEPVPEPRSSDPVELSPGRATAKPTAKARTLLEKHQLKVEDVPHTGDRLSAKDIELYLEKRGSKIGEPAAAGFKNNIEENLPDTPGSLQPLTAEEHGMVSTVAWHRDHVASAYLEVIYNPQAWEEFARVYAERHKLMLSPLLPLMAHRLVELARETPKINTTLVNGQKYQYDQVNLGFTVQVGDTLYLTVVQQANAMDDKRFIEALGEVQRHAMAKKLQSEESRGATVGFSSMARWPVSRHVPILAPYTSLMVAHSAAVGTDGTAVLGASYDHRVLSGADVARVLQGLMQPSDHV